MIFQLRRQEIADPRFISTVTLPPHHLVTHPADNPTPRRDFLGQIAASAIVLAGAACATPASSGQTAAAPAPTPNRPANPPAPTHWDDSWVARLTAKHKAVFDSPDIEDGLAVFQAAGYIRAMRDAAAAGADEVQAVVVIRHSAIPMAFNDAMWAKYSFGKDRKVKDPSGKWATRNPFVSAAPNPNQPASPTSGASSPRAQPTLEWLALHGNILLGCDLATRGEAAEIAQRIKGDATAIYQELKANLIPGLILQPTGVYAAHRAQEAGCTYIRST